MLNHTSRTLAGLLLLGWVAACGPNTAADVATEANAEETLAATADAVSTYYTTRQDLRRCAWPACGGSWVRVVNRSTTRCSDGVLRAECYVTELQNSAGLSDEEWQTARGRPNIVRADMTTINTPVGTWGALRASEIWNAMDDQLPTGTFFQITDLQIRCFAAPCFSLAEATLNSRSTVNLSGLDGRLGVAAGERLPLGRILVAGRNQRVSGGGRVVLVDQLYSPAQHLDPLCAEFTTVDRRVRVKNFPGDQLAAAMAWVASDPQVMASGVGAGTCVAWNEKPCEPQDPPVCGQVDPSSIPFPSMARLNHASLCEFRKVLRGMAGTTGEAQGTYQDGVCTEYCATVVVPTGPESKSFYAQSFLLSEDARAWLTTAFPGTTGGNIDNGLCGAQPTCANPASHPVCGMVRSEVSSTYGAPCFVMDAVLRDAGSGSSKGGWTEGACRAPAAWVTPLDVTVARLVRDASNRYELVVPAQATRVEITTQGGSGDVDLYVRKTALPSEQTYDCRSWASGNQETCSFTASPGGVTYQIMLLGYNLLSTNIQLVAKYYLP